MMKKVLKIKSILTLTWVAVLLFNCSGDDGYGSPEPVPPTPENAVRLRNDATFGQVLTNSEGFTLYFFALDANGNSSCLGGCADAWPVFFEENLTLDSGLESSDFGTITRSDGEKQTTYKGWPLYRFSNDSNAGQVNGDGNNGVWFVGKPDYSVMLVRTQLIGRDADGNETELTSTYEPGTENTFYITDAWGNTLYRFSKDKNGDNTFTASDFSNNNAWPIFHTEVKQVPTGLSVNGFAEITVFGELQLTYKGWPLYHFGGDDARGENFGVGFPKAGIWPILNSDTEIAE